VLTRANIVPPFRRWADYGSFQTHTQELVWDKAEWLATASGWIRERVDVTGEIEQAHVRWWSTVLRVPTTDGDLFFKAVAPVHRFEAGLTARLADLQPGGSRRSWTSTLSAAGS
jgi:hypothetical protein